MTEKYFRKRIGSYLEEINFSNDPDIFLFYQHLLAGLEAFKNSQDNANESFAKYLQMLRIAEVFLSKKFGLDFIKVKEDIRKRLREREKEDPNYKFNETDVLLEEISVIAELLDTRSRRVTVDIIFDRLPEEELEELREEAQEKKQPKELQETQKKNEDTNEKNDT